MSISSLKVKIAFKDFQIAAKHLLNATRQTYQSNVKNFMGLVRKDKIINNILKDFLEMSLEFSEFEKKDDPSGERLELPIDTNKKIAYVLQILNKSYGGEFTMQQYAYRFFHEAHADKALYLLNEQLIEPNISMLIEMLRDLISYEAKGKKEVMEENLRIL